MTDIAAPIHNNFWPRDFPYGRPGIELALRACTLLLADEPKRELTARLA